MHLLATGQPSRSLQALFALLAGWSVLAAGDGAALAAEPPAAPMVSTFAPADELVKQVEVFVGDFESVLANEQEYADKKERLAQNAHTLAVVAVALGLHDSPNALKSSAPALVAAAQKLAKAKDYETAKAALVEVKSAVAGKASSAVELKWNQRVASLGQLMKQAATVDTRLRRNLRRFEQLADENARSATLLAVIAQAAVYDTHEVKDPADLGKWHEMAVEMRNAASAAHQAIKSKDKPAADLAVKRLMRSCDECHAVFQTE